MNRRQLIGVALGLPFAKPVVKELLAVPTFHGVPLEYISSMETAVVYETYSIPCFVNEMDFAMANLHWTTEELDLTASIGGAL